MNPTDALTQQVARALQQIPHDRRCWSRQKYEVRWPCDCSREQRVVAWIAAFGGKMWDSGAHHQKYGEPTQGAFRSDFAAAVKAVPQRDAE